MAGVQKAIVPLVVLTLWGCSIYERPTARLEDVRIGEVSGSRAKLTLVLKVRNRNGYGIRLSPMSYRLWVDGRPALFELERKTFELAARSESLLEVPLLVDYGRVLDAVGPVLLRQPVRYEMKGKARLGIFSFEFDWDGEYRP